MNTILEKMLNLQQINHEADLICGKYNYSINLIRQNIITIYSILFLFKQKLMNEIQLSQS